MTGPVIVITRTKPLASQILEEMVKLNKTLPDRIACWSDVDHIMDLKEPLAVGTISDPNVKAVVHDVFTNNKNVLIGAVIDHGSVELLKFCLDKQFSVRIIIDELAEAIHGKEGEELSDKTDKHNTLDIIYKLDQAGLLLKLFGFDAVWKNSSYHGMNDETLWGCKGPVVNHTQYEMTFEENVLVPVHLYAIAIDEVAADLNPSDSKAERKRKIEIAANIAVLNEEIDLLNSDKQSQAKLLGFSSGSKSARKNKSILDKKFPHQLDLNEVILASTSQDNRSYIQKKLASKDTKIGFVTNYDIWTKGIDIPDLTAVILGYGRLPGSEKLTHIIGRVSRRASDELRLPIEELKIKPEGRFYVPYLVNEKDGGKKYQTVLDVWNNLYDEGITVDVTLITGGSGNETKKRKDKLFTVENGLFEVDDAIQEAIKIREALKAELIKRNKIEEEIDTVNLTVLDEIFG